MSIVNIPLLQGLGPDHVGMAFSGGSVICIVAGLQSLNVNDFVT